MPLIPLVQVGVFPSRQAAQQAIAPAMEQQRQWFDKLRAELAPPAGKGDKKGQGRKSGLLSSERLPPLQTLVDVDLRLVAAHVICIRDARPQ